MSNSSMFKEHECVQETKMPLHKGPRGPLTVTDDKCHVIGVARIHVKCANLFK